MCLGQLNVPPFVILIHEEEITGYEVHWFLVSVEKEIKSLQ